MPKIRKTKVEFEGRIEEREVIVEEEHVETWPRGATLRLVGKPTPRVDGVARVSGRALYTHDVQLPRMLIGRFLRSPHPHARIKAVDSAKAEALPGVALVWHRYHPAPIATLEGREIFPEEVAYEGAEVAFVAARDDRTAEDALALINVTYELLPFAFDLESATAEDAPKVLLDEGNWVSREGDVYQRGDVGTGLGDADEVVELTFTTPIASHCCLETHGSAASWEGDQVTVWHSTQSVFGTRSSVADALGIPMDKVRVISDYIGGGFGSKWGAEPYTLMAILAARETRRPVKAVLGREEEHLAAGYRPGSWQRVRLGAREDGTLTLIEHDAKVATGAFGGGGPVIGGPSKDLYACPNVRTVVRTSRTNADHARAFRAPGYVEGTFALEGAMDALAHKLGMDPLTLRMKNYAEMSPSRGGPYTFKGLRQAYEMGAERFGWSRAVPTDLPNGQGPWRRGRGIASQIWGGGGGPPANAIVRLLPDGTAELSVGVQDIGTGTKTVLTQVAAEELGLPLEAVRCIIGDTLPAPYGPGSGGSVTLASTTPAVRSACREVLRQVIALAAVMLGLEDASVDDFDVERGDIVYRKDPDRRLAFARVTAKMGDYTIVAKGARGPNPDDKAVNTFGAHFAEVAVNVETGQLRVERIVAVHDIGRVVNPLTATSQVYGGVMMGVGYATTEERIIDPATGLQLTANLEDYKVPLVTDTPAIEVLFVDVADTEANSVGSKGLGEPPIIPVAAAIANAVFDAVGVRVTDLPITPDRLLALLSRASNAGFSKEVE
ncbi:MAG: xanthine dehydrogenase family protein molybdopterin-binding subunit [Anaerolineae bacterium]|nr:xanthine dehydrogenase family protein molybdopterin-binding subunit [Anaerolineae bacterium]